MNLYNTFNNDNNNNNYKNNYNYNKRNNTYNQWRIQDLTLGGAWTLSTGGGVENH